MNSLRRLRSYLRASLELLRGYRAFSRIHPSVTVFGSARFAPDHPFCRLSEELGSELAKAGFAVVSGAGPGVMEAVSRGAKQAGGRTVGANIIIPHEQRSNPYIDRSITFTDFWSRKRMLINYACGFVVMPGGFGTLDELTEVLNLFQSRKMAPVPVVLIGTEFWAGFMAFCRDTLLPEGAISADFFELIRVVDSPAKAVELIERSRRDQHAPDHDREHATVNREAQIAKTPENVE